MERKILKETVEQLSPTACKFNAYKMKRNDFNDPHGNEDDYIFEETIQNEPKTPKGK